MKYDLKKLEAKLTNNALPKSMRNFDAAAYVRLHSVRRDKSRIIRPSAVQEIFASCMKVLNNI